MKGIFKKMKGRAGKKGSSLIAVMTAMAVLSIVALCAAGIAITNYRTTQTYVSQDNYYYSAEAGQAQFVSNMTDYAYSIASDASWSGDNAYSKFYHQIKEAADEFQVQISETLYNGEYKVNNEIILPEGGVFPNVEKYEFTIKTTVTNANDGTTQEYYSTVTVQTPTSNGESLFTDTGDIFNKGYALVANGSAKNNDWYGLWGGFNTYYTQKVAKNSPVSKTPNLSKIYTGESKPSEKASFYSTGSWNNKTYYSYSGIFHKLGTTDSIANNPDSYDYLHKFSSDSAFGKGDVVSKIDGLESVENDGLSVNIDAFITSAKDAPGVLQITKTTSDLKFVGSEITKDRFGRVTGTTPATITLNSANNKTSGYNKYYSNTEKYYYNSANDANTKDVVIEFGATVGTTRFEGLQKGEFYRVICNNKGTSHGIAYQLDANENGTIDTLYTSSWTANYTYFDHYYQNKFFFFDLGGDGTLKINNRTKVYNSAHIGDVFGSLTNNVTDAWGNKNGVADGNIVLEDCTFFVNGNIEVGNAFNFSNCKVFATGNITLRSVYYMEGLLSSETDAGSDIIKQSLYYCEGLFESKLISRYAMDWALEKNGKYYQLSSYSFPINHPWQIDCLLDNGNTHVSSGYTGLLATYRYPTVLKAVIIAKGNATISNMSALHTSGGDVSGMTITTNGVSVYLNPNGSVDKVVDTILIEGQIYAKNKILIANYNEAVMTDTGWFGFGSKSANRFAGSSQLQYHDYQGDMSFEGVGGSITEDVFGSTPVIVQNSGIAKK